MSHQPYDTLVLRMGHTNIREVIAVLTPRDDFLETVDRVLEAELTTARGHIRNQEGDEFLAGLEPKLEAAAEEMRETARRMDRFPFNAWINEDRGCGCVVGEYMVAHGLLTRFSSISHSLDVQAGLRTLHGPYVAEFLSDFGSSIDMNLRHLVQEKRTNLRWTPFAALAIVDDFEEPLAWPWEIVPAPVAA